MSKYIGLTAAIILVFVPVLRADCRRVTFVRQHHAPVVVKEVVKVVDVVQTLVTPVLPIYAPAYGAVYTPPQNATGTNEVLEAIRTLNANVQQLSQRLSQLEGGGRLPPMQRADDPPKLGGGGTGDAGNAFLVLTQKFCASCHDASVSQIKGGKFSMIQNGKLTEFTPEQTGSIVSKVLLKEMPRSGTMSDSERLQYLAAFAGGK